MRCIVAYCSSARSNVNVIRLYSQRSLLGPRLCEAPKYTASKKKENWTLTFLTKTVHSDTLNLPTPHHTTPHTSLNRYFSSLFPKTPKILCITLVLQLQQLSTFYGKTRVRMFKANFKRKVWNINEVLCCFNITGLSKILFLLI